MIKMRELFSQKLLTDGGEINDKILALLDIDQGRELSLRIKINDGELITGGSAEIADRSQQPASDPFQDLHR